LRVTDDTVLALVLAGHVADRGGQVDQDGGAVEAGSDEGATKVLPRDTGPPCTASCRALPCRYCGQLKNHSVQPSSRVHVQGMSHRI
jgi:hypothetical protein